jgi:hypothetical protein
VPVDDRTRLQLHRRLEEVLGVEEANTLMDHLPPVGWRDVATKQDLSLVTADIAALRVATKQGLAITREHLEARIKVSTDELRVEMYKGFTRQAWLMFALVGAFNSLLAGYLTLVVTLAN